MRAMLSRIVLATLIATTPIAVAVPTDTPDDQEFERIRVTAAGGFGQYSFISLFSSCSEDGPTALPVRYHEFAGEFDYRVSPNWSVGFRGGFAQDRVDPPDTQTAPLTRELTTDIAWGNPYVSWRGSINGNPWGAGIGYVWADRAFIMPGELDAEIPVSAHLHLGLGPRAQLEIALMESMPLYATGYMSLGSRVHATPNDDIWLGMGFLGPQDQVGFVGGWDHAFPTGTSVGIRGRLGSSRSDEFEGGLGLSVSQTFR